MKNKIKNIKNNITLEEKAKRYDEAFAYARNVYRLSSNPAEIQRMAEIFPELIESEDEKVRKAIIDFFSEPGRKEYILNGFTVDNIIAWLEKQGQKKHKFIIGDIISDGKVEFRVDNIVKNAIGQDCYFLVNIESEKNGTRYCKLHDSEGKTRNSGETTWLCEQVDAKFEKQDEKIPVIDFKAKDWYVSKVDGKIHNIYYSADKVEPKFHEGDWITNDDYTWKIVEVKPLDYILQSQDGNIVDDNISYVDEQFHSFTIEDAKDGDVLFHSDSASNGIFIFKELFKYEFGEEVICYCDYDSEDHFCLGEHHTCCWADAKILHPATKEQRALLFSKMKEAGWKWDAEKKELKKIEQKSADKIKPKFHVGDTVRHKNIEGSECTIEFIDDLTYFGDTTNFDIKDQNNWELVEQKSTCSKEDEEYNGEDYGIDGLWHAMNILERTLGKVSGYQTDDGFLSHQCAITAVKKLYKQKSGWNEEDDKRLKSCLNILQPKTLVGNVDTINTKWLKSLKERYKWKPSDIQMKALKEACDKHWEPDGLDPLHTLYEQLKKLTE